MTPPPINIDGSDITGATIDGTDVQEVTVDGTQVFSAIPDSGVSRWTFDDADTDSGTATDVWNGNDGTINGPTTGQAGVSNTYDSGESYSYDETDDSVDIGNVSDFDLQNFSFAAWIYDDGGTNREGIYWNNASDANGNGWKIATINDEIEVNIIDSNGGSNVFTTSYTQQTPQHIVVTYDGSDLKIYVNGSESASQSLSITVSYGSDPTAFGYRPVAGDRYFGGRIDDSRLYSKALSSTEVSNLYNNGLIL